MKCFATIALLACISLAHAEPPVPQNQYLPPNQQAHQPSSNYLPPSSNYLPPNQGAGSAPSSAYGAPAVTSAIFRKGGGGGGYGGGHGGNSGYGSQGGYGGGDEGNYGPAKYEFKYDVQDYESGNDFGHMESRDGDLAVGRYYVLLPDGRKQIVDYEADQHGYRPTIRYEQVNGGLGGHGGGGAGGHGGYDANGQSGKFGGYH